MNCQIKLKQIAKYKITDGNKSFRVKTLHTHNKPLERALANFANDRKMCRKCLLVMRWSSVESNLWLIINLMLVLQQDGVICTVKYGEKEWN